MIPLNVSFGIYAFLPMGWLFMAFVILGEGFLMSWYLIRKKFDKKMTGSGFRGLQSWKAVKTST